MKNVFGTVVAVELDQTVLNYGGFTINDVNL